MFNKLVQIKMEDLVITNNRTIKVIEPQNKINLSQWFGENKKEFDQFLAEHGAVLFRNFSVYAASDFQRCAQSAVSKLMDYVFRSTPRTKVGGKIYTSTEYPANQKIPLHNECSYTNQWPDKIFFCCLVPPGMAGETPIADSRRIYEKIPKEIKEKFESKGVMYLRNYGGGIDLSWQEVFQTENKEEVEFYCQENNIQFEWFDDKDQLRTKQICQAVITHPLTKEKSWFNQAHLFHISELPSEIQKILREQFSDDELPRNTFYGDGSPIEESTLNEIRQVYHEEEMMFPWQRGDVMVLDNRIMCHGRSPFSGDRKIVVAMGADD